MFWLKEPRKKVFFFCYQNSNFFELCRIFDQERKKMPYMGFRFVKAWKRKVPPYQVGLVQKQLCKSTQSLVSKHHSFGIILSNNSSFSFRYETEQTIIKFLTINSLRSKLNAHLLVKLKKNFLCMKLCSNTFQSLTFLIVLQTLQFILICIRK